MMSLMKCSDTVINSVDLIIWTICNKQQTAMIMKIHRQWTEQNNGGNTHRKYSVGTSNSIHPLMLLLLLFSFFSFAADVVGIKILPLNL